jgi:gluconate kinase
MRASLAPSQIAALESLQAEVGLAVDATHPPEDIVAAAISQLTAQGLLAVLA